MKNKQRIITLVAVLGFLLITVGVTYAFFSYIGSGSTENTISSDSITFLYEEINQQGNGISIENATPVSDTVGRQGQAFNFRIISTATNTISIPYEIDVRKKDGSDNLDSIVKLSLSKVDGNNQETEVELSKYGDLTTVTKNNHEEKQLHIDKVPANTNGYSQQYRLRMWIDENTDFSTGNYNEKTFSVTVNVYSTGHVETDADRQAASRTDVTSLSVNNTVLTQVSENYYEMEVSDQTTQATIDLVTTNPYTQAVIEKTDSTYTNVIAMNTGIQRLSTSKTVTLDNNANYFRIRLASEDGTTNTTLRLYISKRIVATIFGTNYNVVTAAPNLTTSTSNVNSNDASGLYVSTDTNSGNPTYYFRGIVNDNYVRFANMDWRIVRINEDGTIRIILDDSIDTNTYKFNTSTSGISNTYYSNTNQANSAMKILNDWYDANLTSYDSKIATAMYCEAARVGASGTNNGATITLYDQYTPTFTCTGDINTTNIPHGVLNLKIGLLSYDELVYAGAYPRVSNKTFYLYKNYDWWTMSPAGERNDRVAYVWSCDDSDTTMDWNRVDNSYRYRPVINLKADTTATKQVIDGKTYYVVN